MMPRRLMARLTPFAFLAPAAAVLGVFFLGAVGQVVFYSFTRYTAFSGPDVIGLENYRRLLASVRFWACLANSAFYLLVTPAIVPAKAATTSADEKKPAAVPVRKPSVAPAAIFVVPNAGMAAEPPYTSVPTFTCVPPP